MGRFSVSVLVFGLAFPALANDGLSGEFRFSGNDCSMERVVLSPTRLNMGHVQCSFSGNTAVDRMTAELRDATCDVEGSPVQTRYFISRNSDGILLFSPDLGAEFLQACEK